MRKNTEHRTPRVLFLLKVIFVFFLFALFPLQSWALSPLAGIERELVGRPDALKNGSWCISEADPNSITLILLETPQSSVILDKFDPGTWTLPVRIEDSSAFLDLIRNISLPRGDIYGFWYTPDGKIIDLLGRVYKSFSDLKALLHNWRPDMLSIRGDFKVYIPYTVDGVYYLFIGVRPSGSRFEWDDEWWSFGISAVPVFNWHSEQLDLAEKQIHTIEDLASFLQQINYISLYNVAQNQGFVEFLRRVMPPYSLRIKQTNCLGYAYLSAILLHDALGLRNVWIISAKSKEPKLNHAFVLFRLNDGTYGYTSNFIVRVHFATALEAIEDALLDIGLYDMFVINKPGHWFAEVEDEKIYVSDPIRCRGMSCFFKASYTDPGIMFFLSTLQISSAFPAKNTIAVTKEELEEVGWEEINKALEAGKYELSFVTH
jgi:hypothetical protein